MSDDLRNIWQRRYEELSRANNRLRMANAALVIAALLLSASTLLRVWLR